VVRDFGHLRKPREAERLRQGGSVGEDCSVMISVSTLGIEPATFRDRFEQRGLATAIFTDEKRDVASKTQDRFRARTHRC